MSDDLDAMKVRKADLERKLQARLNCPGFEGNVRALKAAISDLDAKISDAEGNS